jgi:hypothetical protein
LNLIQLRNFNYYNKDKKNSHLCHPETHQLQI